MSAEAIVDTQEESQPEVKQYVPNLKCVACGKAIQLDVPDYAFYGGRVRCESCQAVMEVEIGDWFRSDASTKSETTVPVQGLAGGRILSEPRLVSPGIAVPPSFLQVVHTDKIALEAQRHMRNALSHYADGTYKSAMIMCRSA